MTRRMFEHLALLLFPLVYAGGLLSAAWKFLQPIERRPVQEKFPLEVDRAYFADGDAPPVEMIAVLTPISRPAESSSGPPELPGLMAASVWMKNW